MSPGPTPGPSSVSTTHARGMCSVSPSSEPHGLPTRRVEEPMSRMTPYLVGTIGALLVSGLTAAVPAGVTEPVVGTPERRDVGVASGAAADPAARRDDIQAQIVAEAL